MSRTDPPVHDMSHSYSPFFTRNKIKSFTRLEYPHSLSYQLMTLPVLPTTFV